MSTRNLWPCYYFFIYFNIRELEIEGREKRKVDWRVKKLIQNDHICSNVVLSYNLIFMHV